MPRIKLTARNVEAAQPSDRPREIYDAELKGLILRVQPSGVKTFIVQVGRGKRETLKPRYPAMTLAAARTQAHVILSNPAKHVAAKREAKISTLRQFLDNDLLPWAVANRKWGAGSVKRIKTAFADRLDKPLTDLNAWIIEKWRSRRLKSGTAEGTVNRELAGLKSAMAKAVEWGALAANPIASVKLRKIDNERVRYLTRAEEERLRAALAKRDREGVASRGHLLPMVLVALNTGLRRGELTALEWTDVNLPAKRLHVRAAAAKSGRSRHVPLNAEAVAVLTRWQRENAVGRVFNVRDVKTAWHKLTADAKIDGLNFHDLRHCFASNLVMAGVDLNTVRELLGHADLKMTLRYAHLAQEHKAKAVEMLGRR